MIVVDASVAVKWFLKEAHSVEAITLLTLEEKLVGPNLIAYEVAGAFLRAFQRQEIDRATCMHCQDRWLHAIQKNVLQISFVHADIDRGGEIAAELGHALADCIYLAMAERLRGRLVTADLVFFEKAHIHFAELCFIDDVTQLMPAPPAHS